MLINYFLFAFIYLGFVEGNRFKAVIQGLFNPKLKTSSLEDKRLLSFLQKKTALTFRLKIIESPQMFGYAAGTPMNPYMVLSTGIYKDLTWDELQWVLLHEAGHTKGWHVVKITIVHLSIFALGIYFTATLPLTITIVFACIFAMITFQMERLVSESQADKYAVKRIDHPQGMVTANKKFKTYWSKHSNVYRYSLLIRLFTPHLTYDERMVMARNEMKNRSYTQ